MKRAEGAIYVDARDHHQPDATRQSVQRYLRVHARQRMAIDRGIGPEGGELGAMVAQLRAIHV